MIERSVYEKVVGALKRQAAVALIGPRQVGKTTLAFEIAKTRPSIYLDLESYQDREKLKDPILFLNQYKDSLVILDEIHRMPEIFQTLRSVIDQRRREGRKVAHFLILGSASLDLLRQSGETLAGRIAYVDMNPVMANEIEAQNVISLWVRGGFPESYLAKDDKTSFMVRQDFIKTYLNREILQFNPRIAAETIERLWIMLAHCQGGLLNASKLATNLSVATKTLGAYVDLLVDLLLVRRLKPYHNNVGKRLVKAPKIYIRDSGLCHALLNLADYNTLSGSPVYGASWEGFVIENILANCPPNIEYGFYRTSAGAEIDLLLKMPSGEIWALEIKSGLKALPTRGFYNAIEDVQANKSFIIYAGEETYPLSEKIQVIGLRAILDKLREV